MSNANVKQAVKTTPEGTMSSQNRVDALNITLANAILFYQKLHHFHWRVTGPMFFRLHEKFQELYEFWGQAADDVAERILAIGGLPLATLREVLEQSSLKEETGTPEGMAMAASVSADLRQQSQQIRAALETAEQAGDRSTVNLLDSILDRIEKDLWMLGALQTA